MELKFKNVHYSMQDTGLKTEVGTKSKVTESTLLKNEACNRLSQSTCQFCANTGLALWQSWSSCYLSILECYVGMLVVPLGIRFPVNPAAKQQKMNLGPMSLLSPSLSLCPTDFRKEKCKDKEKNSDNFLK